MAYPKCQGCGVAEYRHLIDEAHGISGTYMDKSERFECRSCGMLVNCNSSDAILFPFIYEKIK